MHTHLGLARHALGDVLLELAQGLGVEVVDVDLHLLLLAQAHVLHVLLDDLHHLLLGTHTRMGTGTRVSGG
jgi:hypothetical protein